MFNNAIRIEKLTKNVVTLEKIIKHTKELTWLLNNDNQLRFYLCPQYLNIISEQTFVETTKEWIEEKSSDTYAIVIDKKAIGTISLSHQDTVKLTARIGYWLGSQYWNKGYARQAFRGILCSAKQKGIEYVSTQIEKDNVASLRLWEKYHAQSTLINDRYHMVINVMDTKL